MAVVLAFGSACLPQNEDANEVRSSELVFDKRNVEATRGLWEWSRKVPNEADLGANLAAHSRTAAVIYSKKLSGPNCDPSVISRVAGTSILTSDTRALAAFHSCRTDVRNYNLKFESYGGLMWADTAAHTSYPPSDEWTQDYRFDAVEEFPFLANRLFALGLDEWAYLQSGTQARERLRTGWWFEIEDIRKDDWHYTDKSWFGQGLMPLDPAIPGKDLVLLKARPLDPPAWGDIRSFPMTAPAVFFDQAPLAKPQNGFPRLESKLETAYTSEFVNFNDLVPSACTEGIYKGSEAIVSEKLCISAGAAEVGLKFHHLHQSTVDSAPGTSGGAVLSRNLRPAADGWSGYRYRQVFGAISQATSIASAIPPGWGSPVTYPDYRTAFTEIGADWVLFNRDGDNPPFPFPTFNPNDYVHRFWQA